MEWVETTARTVAEAKDSALDQLGVDEAEAQFEVLEEPRAGLFGRLRGEARVRARVAPKRPRPKAERKGRRRRSEQGGESGQNATGTAPATSLESVEDELMDVVDEVTDTPTPVDGPNSGSPKRDRPGARARGAAKSGRSPERATSPAGRFQGSTQPGAVETAERKGTAMDEPVVEVERQAEVVDEFLAGLLEAFGVVADVRTTRIDDETIELAVEGDDLGLLIGPKGQTLLAIQDLSRTVVQRRLTGRHEGRVRVDVSGYRQRRREALARFTEQVANKVKASGVQNALEPMGAADRKIVHDTANEIDGVSTISEGEDPRRRVVILPTPD